MTPQVQKAEGCSFKRVSFEINIIYNIMKYA